MHQSQTFSHNLQTLGSYQGAYAAGKAPGASQTSASYRSHEPGASPFKGGKMGNAATGGSQASYHQKSVSIMGGVHSTQSQQMLAGVRHHHQQSLINPSLVQYATSGVQHTKSISQIPTKAIRGPVP